MLLDKPIPFWYIFKKVRVELMYIVAISLTVYILTRAFEHVIPEMPFTIPGFLGTALSVLLSFKLNQSYDRWWEARKIWGSIVNDSRNLVLQLQAFVAPGHETEIRRVARRQAAWCYCLGQNLRQRDPLERVDGFIDAEELQAIANAQNKPLALLQQNNREIAGMRQQGLIDSYNHVQLNTTLVNLTNSMGMAERIKSTVFPVTYRLFLHTIIYLFIITLSISLRDLRSYFEIPLLVIIGSLFFLLERTAFHLQDPFSDKPTDTAVTAISRTIETNIAQLLDEPVAPATIPEPTFYLK